MMMVFFSLGSIEKEVFLNFVDKDMEVYMNFLLEIDYVEFLCFVICEGNFDFVKFE